MPKLPTLHEIALENLAAIRAALSPGLLSHWQEDFIFGLLENERLTADSSKLSPKEFSRLQQIANHVRRHTMKGKHNVATQTSHPR